MVISLYHNFFTADHELALATGMKMGDSALSSRIKACVFRELQAAERVDLFSREILSLGERVSS